LPFSFNEEGLSPKEMASIGVAAQHFTKGITPVSNVFLEIITCILDSLSRQLAAAIRERSTGH